MDSSSLQDILAGLDESFRDKGDSFLAAEEEDRDTFPVTNHSYRLQIAHLEGRLRDYADLLQAKEREISLAKTLQQPSALRSDETKTDPRLLKIEEENKQLRGLSYLRSEIERLKRELIHAQRTKSALEAKFNEAAQRLAAIEKVEDTEAQGEEVERMREMLRKVELFKHANSDLHSQVAILTSALQAANTERDHLRSTIVPQLQKSIAQLQEEIRKLESELGELKGSPISLKQRTKESHVSIVDLEGLTVETPIFELMTDRLDTRACYSPTSDNLSPHCRSPSRQRASPSFIRKSVPGSQMAMREPIKPLFPTQNFRKPVKVITSRPAGLLKKSLQQKKPRDRVIDRFADLFPLDNEAE